MNIFKTRFNSALEKKWKNYSTLLYTFTITCKTVTVQYPRSDPSQTCPWLKLKCLHRVDRVLGFFSSRPNWDHLTRRRQCPPLWFRGWGGHTRWGGGLGGERRWEMGGGNGAELQERIHCISHSAGSPRNLQFVPWPLPPPPTLPAACRTWKVTHSPKFLRESSQKASLSTWREENLR